MAEIIFWSELEAEKLFRVIKLEIINSEFWVEERYLCHLSDGGNGLKLVWISATLSRDIQRHATRDEKGVYILKNTQDWVKSFVSEYDLIPLEDNLTKSHRVTVIDIGDCIR